MPTNRLDIDTWEEEFIRLFTEKIDEEPLYEYIHLYKKGLSPAEALIHYLKENPDYAEKLEDLAETTFEKADQPETDDDFYRKVKELQRQNEASRRLSEFCPNCARRLGNKKICKCGYKRSKKES